MLDRTGSPSLAGATVAAITFPSLVSGPLLGAWLDLTGRRRTLMVIDQLVIASVLVALVLLVGHAPNWVIPLVVIPAGITYPLSFGGFTSMIPALVPGELLPPANALETTSFNSALVIGPALAGTLSAVVAPAAPLIVEAALALAALALIVRIPGLDRPPEHAPDRTLLERRAATACARSWRCRSCARVTAAAAFGMCGLGLLDGRVPAVRRRAPRRGSGAPPATCGRRSPSARRSARSASCGSSAASRPSGSCWPATRCSALLMLSWPLAGSLPVLPRARRASPRWSTAPRWRRSSARRQVHVPPSLYGQVFTTAVGLKVGSFSLGAALGGVIATGLGSAETIVIAATAADGRRGGRASRLRVFPVFRTEMELLALRRLVGLELGRRERLRRGVRLAPRRRACAAGGGS